MSIETKLKTYADLQKNSIVNKEKLQCTIEKSKEEFWKSQTSVEVSWLEFLYQQAAYIQKRWWFGQGLLLAILWLILYLSNSNVYERRCVGILIPCFVILFLPELWKNRSSIFFFAENLHCPDASVRYGGYLPVDDILYSKCIYHSDYGY